MDLPTLDLPMIIGIGIAGAILIVLIAIALAMTLKRIFGGRKMKPIPMKKQLEDIQEPNEDEIEMADEQPEEGENEEPTEERKAICMILVEGGKAYRGEFLGEDAQFVTLPNGKLVKQDAVWVKMRTEKTPLLVINKRHIILMAFENLPTVQVPTKPKPQKQKEETEAEGAIEDMTI
jgi:hypothetical protein